MALALPLLLGNVFQASYNLVDTMIMGRSVGSGSLAGVGVASPVFHFVNALLIGLSMGSSIVVSQLFGAGREKELPTAVSTVVWTSLAMAAVLALVGQLPHPDRFGHPLHDSPGSGLPAVQRPPLLRRLPQKGRGHKNRRKRYHLYRRGILHWLRTVRQALQIPAQPHLDEAGQDAQSVESGQMRPVPGQSRRAAVHQMVPRAPYRPEPGFPVRRGRRPAGRAGRGIRKGGQPYAEL